jgi:hypothetical protein
LTPGLRVEADEIEAILRNEIIERNVIDGDEATEAYKRVKRSINKKAKTKAKTEFC